MLAMWWSQVRTVVGLEVRKTFFSRRGMWVYLLAYNLIRLLMAQAAHQERVLPRQLSFKHTLQVWLAWSMRQLYFPDTDTTRELFALIAQIRVGDRPNRVEPRAVKRRPKEYARLMVPREQARRAIIRKQRRKSAAA